MSGNQESAHLRFMALALALGARGQGRVWPNPAVGCVIVKSGRIVGRGWTQPGGRPHAEVVALAQAGDAARGGDVYVTLEPCAHYGETPPCAKALIEAGVARVFAPFQDSDPRVSGAGFDMLRAAGIGVETGFMADQAAADHAGFLLKIETGRPYITLKLASSFDGRIATATGESQWITGYQARRYVHRLRSLNDAVLVGAGTARSDDPALTVRDLGLVHQPVRIVASRRLDVPLMGFLARSAKEIPFWLCHGDDADDLLQSTFEELGAKLISCPVQRTALDVRAMMQALAREGLTRVFCEGFDSENHRI